MAKCGYSPRVGGLKSGDVEILESVPFPKDSDDVDDTTRRLPGVTAHCETLKANNFSCASHVRTTEV